MPIDGAGALIADLDRTLSAEHPPEQRHTAWPWMPFSIRTSGSSRRRLNDEAVACGGVALLDDFAEVKRMYLRRTGTRARRSAGSAFSGSKLEAGAAGLTMLRLETGDRQDAALRLYTHAGFRRCNAFGA